MKAFFSFVRTTVLGGVLFLAPLVVLLLLAEKALQVVGGLAAPVTDQLPSQSVMGIASAEVLVIAGLVVIAFLAGLLARTPLAQRVSQRLEEGLLARVPGYSFVRGIGADVVAGPDARPRYQPVLVQLDHWQIGFVVERVAGGFAAVFVPGAPSPWSGSVMFVAETDLRVLDISPADALKCVQRLGIGAGEVLGNRLETLGREPRGEPR